jgi:hypothetical protein
MNNALVCSAIALVTVGARGQRSNEAQEFHATFPLQDHFGNFLKPRLLEGLNIFTRDIADHIKTNAAADDEQWGADEFFKHNNVSNSSAFCFTVANDTNSAEQDGEEELMSWTGGVLADNQTAIVATKNGHAVGHWCCKGHLPNRSQLASTKCYQTDRPGSLDQVREGEGLLQATVSADGSGRMEPVKKHAHSDLMRSDKAEAHGGDETIDPRIFPTQIFFASFRDGVGSDSLDLAVEQVAHLARATSGLIVVDKRLFGRLMKELGSHPARLRVIEGFFWFLFFIGAIVAVGGVNAYSSHAVATHYGWSPWGARR